LKPPLPALAICGAVVVGGLRRLINQHYLAFTHARHVLRADEHPRTAVGVFGDVEVQYANDRPRCRTYFFDIFLSLLSIAGAQANPLAYASSAIF
jgi:hypothetical protein